MLVTLNEILKIANARKIAVGAFNATSMSTTRAIISAAEELNEPVILQHVQVHEEWGYSVIEEIAPMMLFYADRATVPVCVHLDHATDLSYVKKGLDLGFTSVMYDGSMLSPELNYANTCIARKLSLKYGASLEAEIGAMGTDELGNDRNAAFTDPNEAKEFVTQTGVDALACSFGTAHGLYLKEPKLDFERLAKINKLITVPIVMHGGSGVSNNDYKKVIELGVRKINYYTY